MTQQRIAIDYLRDMAESISNALEFVTDMSFDDFQQDIKTQFAVVRALEIIGEAAKCIPIFPGVAWQGCVTN